MRKTHQLGASYRNDNGIPPGESFLKYQYIQELNPLMRPPSPRPLILLLSIEWAWRRIWFCHVYCWYAYTNASYQSRYNFHSWHSEGNGSFVPTANMPMRSRHAGVNIRQWCSMQKSPSLNVRNDSLPEKIYVHSAQVLKQDGIPLIQISLYWYYNISWYFIGHFESDMDYFFSKGKWK